MKRYYRHGDINIISNSNNYRGGQNNNCEPNKKFDFKCKKDNAIRSLNEVENFLCNLKDFSKYIKLYCLFK